jgi:hypothetical protein
MRGSDAPKPHFERAYAMITATFIGMMTAALTAAVVGAISNPEEQ